MTELPRHPCILSCNGRPGIFYNLPVQKLNFIYSFFFGESREDIMRGEWILDVRGV